MSDTAAGGAPATITRAEVAAQIAARLDGRASGARLSGWAFDRFYQLELGAEACEPGGEDVIAEVLDELMFSDDQGFALSDDDLRGLLARLEAA